MAEPRLGIVAGSWMLDDVRALRVGTTRAPRENSQAFTEIPKDSQGFPILLEKNNFYHGGTEGGGLPTRRYGARVPGTGLAGEHSTLNPALRDPTFNEHPLSD
jgi:hypothetical protein